MSDTKTVPLSRGLFAIVDDEDYSLISQHKWSACKSSHRERFYAICYPKKPAPKRKIAMHRLVMGATDPKIMVDHIDGDGLNNRRSNLRIATNSQNQMNKNGWSKSGYKGVSQFKNKWHASIRFDGKLHSLGNYDTPEQAALIYDKAAMKAFGAFAHLNFGAEEVSR
jgi:hypothetical protein